ncbi:MAG: response regulator [Anaerolineales bacterium]|nr:response regulator [Anaerolineales bacterium]
MLIEDDPTMMSLLNTILSMEGFQVIEWQADGDPLEDILQGSPDLVMIDVHLDERSGIDLMKEIRQEVSLKQLKVLMSSGMDYQAACLENGADDFILKPYMPDELMDKIRNLLDN